MKQKVYTVQYWVYGDQLMLLDSGIWRESHIAGAASVMENLIFFETQIDLGLTYDTETHAFEPVPTPVVELNGDDRDVWRELNGDRQ